MTKSWILFVLLFAAPTLAAAQTGPPYDLPPPPPPANPYELTRFNPSLAVIVVVIISAFFFIAFFFLYLRRCADDPASVRAGGSARRGFRSRRAAPRGLDPAVVAGFPTFEYSVVKDLKIGKATLECAVCLSEFDDDETLRLLPQCSHVFHPDCIDEWLRSHTTCPVCRANLAPGEAPVIWDTTAEEDLEAGVESGDARENIGVSDAIAIDVGTDAEAAPAAAEQQQKPLPRARSMRRPRFTGKFPRSHSTGHSLIQPGENCDRFTLRLPEHIRKEIIKGKLNRTASSVAGGGGEGSSRGRSLSRWDRFTRSDRWVFSMAAPFFSRSFSSRPSGSIRRGGEGGDHAGSSRSGRMFLTSVRAPFDCLTGAKSGADQAESGAAQKSGVPAFSAVTSP